MQGKSATFKAVFHAIVALQSCATSRDRDPKALISLGSDGGKLQDRGFTVEDGINASSAAAIAQIALAIANPATPK